MAGRHEGKGKAPKGQKWLGGTHRDRGCLGVALTIVGTGAAGAVALGLGIKELIG